MDCQRLSPSLSGILLKAKAFFISSRRLPRQPWRSMTMKARTFNFKKFHKPSRSPCRQCPGNTYLCEHNTLHFPCWLQGCHSRLAIRHLPTDVYPSLLGHHCGAKQHLCQGGNGRRKVSVTGKGHTGRAESLPWFLCSHGHQSAPCPR